MVITHHSLTGRKAIPKIGKVEITGDETRIEQWLGSELSAAIGLDVDWVSEYVNDGNLE